MRREFLLPVYAFIMLGAASTAYTQSNVDSARHDCRGAYTAVTLPVARTSLLALQHQCELVLQHDNQRRMDLDLAELRLALLRIHIARHSITASDRRLWETIVPTFAGDAAAILATIYKGKNTTHYETAIIRAAWLAAASKVPMKDAEAAIREAILIYVARRDYASAGKLIQHIEEPVLSNQTENGQLLIHLLQGPHAPNIRGAIESRVGSWDSLHVAILLLDPSTLPLQKHTNQPTGKSTCTHSCPKQNLSKKQALL